MTDPYKAKVIADPDGGEKLHIRWWRPWQEVTLAKLTKPEAHVLAEEIVGLTGPTKREEELAQRIKELQAQIFEYEHALHEVIDCKETCPDCKLVCQGALIGLNREDMMEMVNDG